MSRGDLSLVTHRISPVLYVMGLREKATKLLFHPCSYVPGGLFFPEIAVCLFFGGRVTVGWSLVFYSEVDLHYSILRGPVAPLVGRFR